ncbi:unnamed protein product [Angiostrongylus costaricensis]|uniref:Reverse transcriptase domain-containing protein n=1 Tax=Angiostrongylus costaricensis TaxID=334426 RepID=A0A0R3PQJ8_ANGCS|nr:unnamed protein product [Angiostrongylus costaricensis]
MYSDCSFNYSKDLSISSCVKKTTMVLLKECLNCSIFGWSGKYFAQIRGLAMGQRLAPNLAIVFMSKIEAPVLDLRPLLYCRYVDDYFVVFSTQEEMDKCFELWTSSPST